MMSMSISDDPAVVQILLRPILVGRASTLLSRLVVHVSIDQRVGDAHVQDGALARGEQVVAHEVALVLYYSGIHYPADQN